MHSHGCHHAPKVNIFGYEFSSDDDSGFELENGEIIYSDTDDHRPLSEYRGTDDINSNAYNRNNETTFNANSEPIDYSQFETPSDITYPFDTSCLDENDDLDLELDDIEAQNSQYNRNRDNHHSKTTFYEKIYTLIFPPSHTYSKFSTQTTENVENETFDNANAGNGQFSQSPHAVRVVDFNATDDSPCCTSSSDDSSIITCFFRYLKMILLNIPIFGVSFLIIYDAYYFNTTYLSLYDLPLFSSQTLTLPVLTILGLLFLTLIHLLHYALFNITSLLTLLSYLRVWSVSSAVKDDPPAHGYYAELLRRLELTYDSLASLRHKERNRNGDRNSSGEGDVSEIRLNRDGNGSSTLVHTDESTAFNNSLLPRNLIQNTLETKNTLETNTVESDIEVDFENTNESVYSSSISPSNTRLQKDRNLSISPLSSSPSLPPSSVSTSNSSTSTGNHNQLRLGVGEIHGNTNSSTINTNTPRNTDNFNNKYEKDKSSSNSHKKTDQSSDGEGIISILSSEPEPLTSQIRNDQNLTDNNVYNENSQQNPSESMISEEINERYDTPLHFRPRAPLPRREDFVYIPMCSKCQAPKPPRSHHCSVCGVCVGKMDHHCPWINNCVGKRNYKFFLLFVIYASLGCLMYIPCGINVVFDALFDDMDDDYVNKDAAVNPNHLFTQSLSHSTQKSHFPIVSSDFDTNADIYSDVVSSSSRFASNLDSSNPDKSVYNLFTPSSTYPSVSLLLNPTTTEKISEKTTEKVIDNISSISLPSTSSLRSYISSTVSKYLSEETNLYLSLTWKKVSKKAHEVRRTIRAYSHPTFPASPSKTPPSNPDVNPLFFRSLNPLAPPAPITPLTTSTDSPFGPLIASVVTCTFSIFLSIFAGFHIMLTLSGDTTLENMGGTTIEKRSSLSNWVIVFGPNPWLWWLPVFDPTPQPWNGYELVHPKFLYNLSEY